MHTRGCSHAVITRSHRFTNVWGAPTAQIGLPSVRNMALPLCTNVSCHRSGMPTSALPIAFLAAHTGRVRRICHQVT